MTNFIEEFYYGNIDPQARSFEQNKKVQRDMQMLNESEDFLTNKLSGEEKKNSLVIGADTVVSVCGTVMGKPKDREDAAGMLSLLQGRTHQVYTGVTFIYLDEKGDRDTGRKTERRVNSFFEKTDVLVFPMSEEEIARYVDTGDPMDKAGAYGIQGIFAAYIKGIAGDYNNVVGLPVGRLYQELKKI